LSQGFTSHSTQKQVISETFFPANLLIGVRSTEETKPNTTKANNTRTTQSKLNQKRKTQKAKPKQTHKN